MSANKVLDGCCLNSEQVFLWVWKLLLRDAEWAV